MIRLKMIVRAFIAPILFVASWLYYPLCNSGPKLCLISRFFGYDCPGCGLTRAACLFAHGHFVEAIKMNWRILPVLIIVLAISIKAFITLFSNVWGNCSSIAEHKHKGEVSWQK
ncbi:MAG: DUF2752 domain-containing protein [Lentisphaerae bacterium]|nr:DUF2752 domain-containing protein [Lentisphaerota bacterium]